MATFGLMSLFGYGFNTHLTGHQALILIQLGVFAGLNNSFNYTAIKISVPVALLFHYLAPLLVIVWYLVFPIFYKPISYTSVIALFIALAGVIYMALPNLKEGNRRLVRLGTLSAIFYSLEIVFSGYLSNELHVPAATSSFTKLFFQAMIMPIAGVLMGESTKVSDKNDWPKMVLGGVLLYVSFILYFAGSATVSDLHRGVLGYIDRIGAIALGAYFFKNERAKITKNVWIGGVLILGAGLIILFF